MKSTMWRMGLCLLLCLALALPAVSKADFGSFSGSSDYGGSSSSDSGSSWSGSDSSWSSSGSSDFDGSGGLPFGVIVLIIIVYIFMKKGSGSKPGSGTAAGSSQTPVSRLMSIESYQQIDPLFSSAALSEKLANLYVQMQHAWQDKHIDSVRPYLTDALFTQMDRQLDAMRRQGVTNYIDRIAVLGVQLRGYYQTGQDDHIVAEVRTRIVDYTLEDTTGRLVSGDRQKERFMTYEWDLIRPTGTLTTEKDAMRDISCPNCGAPLSINQSAQCEYCGTVVTLAEHDWVIYAIKGISQVTR